MSGVFIGDFREKGTSAHRPTPGLRSGLSIPPLSVPVMGSKEDRSAKLLQQRREERTSSYRLYKLGHDFYPGTREYLDELRTLLEKELKENPMSQKVDFTRGQYQRALTSATEVRNLRMTKIANLAALAATTGAGAEDLLPEEKGLYETLLRELKNFGQQYEFGTSRERPAEEAPAATPAKAPVSRKEVVVRIVADGPQVPLETFGKTQVHKEEIVSLPEDEAKVLIEAKRAVLVDTSKCS